MQGIAVNDDYVYVSQSEGRFAEHSTLTRIDRVTGERESIDVPVQHGRGHRAERQPAGPDLRVRCRQYDDGREPRSTTTVRNVR